MGLFLVYSVEFVNKIVRLSMSDTCQMSTLRALKSIKSKMQNIEIPKSFQKIFSKSEKKKLFVYLIVENDVDVGILAEI
jgi:hypothetical protein